MDGRISRNKSKQVDEKTVKRNCRNVDGWTGKRISKQQVVEGKAKNGRWEGQVKKWQTGLRKDRQKNSRQVYGRTGKINSRFVDGRTGKKIADRWMKRQSKEIAEMWMDGQANELVNNRWMKGQEK